MAIFFRKITPADVETLFVLRGKVRENPLSVTELAAKGITPQSVTAALGDRLEGYLCEESDRMVGFAMADLKAGELSVIAVLPEYEGRGIGRELLRRTEEALWAAGYTSIWLWTWANRATRAVRLYQSAGWVEYEIKGHQLFMNKKKSGAVSQRS